MLLEIFPVVTYRKEVAQAERRAKAMDAFLRLRA